MSRLIRLTLLGIAAYIAWDRYRWPFTQWAYQQLPWSFEQWVHDYARWVLAFCLGYAALYLSKFGRSWTDLLLQTFVVRRLVGRLAGGAVLIGLMAILAAPAIALQQPELGVISFLAFRLLRPAKIVIGRYTHGIRRQYRKRHFGLGGTARFSSIFEEWANPWRPGMIMLGASLFDPKWLVGIWDDRHFITIASNGSGKGRDCIIPNLIAWPGSALVVDPQRQNAAVTAAERAKRQPVYILDPFGADTAHLNPLDALDPSDNEYTERVMVLADALVVPSGGGGSSVFFDESAQSFVAGLIDYVVRSGRVKKADKHLGTVRRLLVEGLVRTTADNKVDPLCTMTGMVAIGGLADAAAAQLQQGSNNSSADIISTALMHTRWLASPEMRRVLSTSDFSMADMVRKDMTVYLALPSEYLQIHNRFLRLFVNLAVMEMRKAKKRRFATLFLLDEMFSLGKLNTLMDASASVRKNGVRLWPILQSVGQLDLLYGKNWETFFGGAGQAQIFAVNDSVTADYLSKRLGRSVIWKNVQGEMEPARATPLRDASEIGLTASADGMVCIVLAEGRDPFLLRRVPYYELFGKDRYSQDPYETGAYDEEPVEGADV